MVEGRVCTRDTLTESAAMTTAPRSLRVTKRTGLGLYCARHKAARAPPWAPSLASQCLNVRCKKTYRAPQRTYLLASVTL